MRELKFRDYNQALSDAASILQRMRAPEMASESAEQIVTRGIDDIVNRIDDLHDFIENNRAIGDGDDVA